MQTLQHPKRLRRICIIGGSGSGKSTLAQELGSRLNIPVYHLDRELLYDNFIPYSKDKQKNRHANLIKKDRWIIDGNYSHHGELLSRRLQRATLVVFLNVSRLQTIPRVLSRLVKDSQPKNSIPSNAKNSISWKFAKWIAFYSRRKKLRELREYCKKYDGDKLIVLNHDSMENWIKEIIDNKSNMRKSKNKILRVIKIIILALIALLIIAVLFIKFDTPAAAEFTDNVLRPVLGDKNVIYLEKVFFNLSDKTEQITKKSPQAPQFINQAQDNATVVTHNDDLELNPLPQNASFAPLKDEGIWKNKPLKLFQNQEVMAYTFTRPDPARSFAVTTILQVSATKIALGSVAGTKQPGGPVGKPGPGVVPKEIIKNGKLIAAFDGGFQYRDGAYGMIVENTTYLPLKNDLGTIIGYKDGSFKIINYTGQALGNNVVFVRQNCPILIDNGELSVADPKNKTLWGRTLTADIYTWRSGIGITKNGNLLFAVGNNLTPTTLAVALKTAGATNAIQLDINPSWVRFNIFESLGGGKYSSTTLTKDLKDGSKQYLNGYEKDFFYLYQK